MDLEFTHYGNCPSKVQLPSYPEGKVSKYLEVYDDSLTQLSQHCLLIRPGCIWYVIYKSVVALAALQT